MIIVTVGGWEIVTFFSYKLMETLVDYKKNIYVFIDALNSIFGLEAVKPEKIDFY